MKYRIFFYVLTLLTVFGFVACEETPIPKPRGYYRIKLPETEYQKVSGRACDFEILKSSNLVNNPKNKNWFSVEYPSLNGILYFTYFNDKNIEKLSEDGRKSAFDHAVKADEIVPIPFALPDKNLYGLVYSIEGNAATPMILMMTDSIDQFLHATFYFETVPNADSLRPLTHFIRQDAQHIIETFEWSKHKQN